MDTNHQPANTLLEKNRRKEQYLSLLPGVEYVYNLEVKNIIRINKPFIIERNYIYASSLYPLYQYIRSKKVAHTSSRQEPQTELASQKEAAQWSDHKQIQSKQKWQQILYIS